VLNLVCPKFRTAAVKGLNDDKTQAVAMHSKLRRATFKPFNICFNLYLKGILSL
jgi:hypothetical protein